MYKQNNNQADTNIRAAVDKSSLQTLNVDSISIQNLILNKTRSPLYVP